MRKTRTKLLSLLLTLCMVITMLPAMSLTAFAAAGDSPTNPVICDTYAELKAAMEDTSVLYVQLEGCDEVMPSYTGETLSAGITVNGNKTLTVNGITTFTCGGDSRYATLMTVKGGTTLTVNGTGILYFKASLTNGYNSVIHNQGGNVIVEGNVSLRGHYNTAVYGSAINQQNGNLRIYGGSFLGFAALELPTANYGVYIGGGTFIIEDGTFAATNDNSTTSLRAGLYINNAATGSISGGTFYAGISILNPGSKTIADYLGDGCGISDYTYGTKVDANTASITDDIEVIEYTEVNNINITVLTAPVAYAMPDYTVSNGTGYNVTDVNWYTGSSSHTGAFEANAVYAAYLYIKPATGYYLASSGDLAVSINGNAATVARYDGATTGVLVRYIFPATMPPINSVNANVTAPVAGANPVAPTMATANSTVYSYAWQEVGGAQLNASSTFEAGKTYRCAVVVHPYSGYVFPTTATATVNGNAAIITGQGSDYISFYYDFAVPVPTYSINVVNGVVAQGTATAGTSIMAIPLKSANPGKLFSHWESSDITISDPTDSILRFTMPAKNVTVTAVFDEAVTLTGTANYTSSVRVGSLVSVGRSGFPTAATDLQFQWQSSNNATSGFTDISGATASAYTPTASDVGKYIRLVITATGYEGSVMTPAQIVSKALNAEDPVRPMLTTEDYTSLEITNYQTAQEYVYRTSPVADTSTINWSEGAITGNTATGLTTNTTYYVYTRIKETASAEAGTKVATYFITLYDKTYLSQMVLEGYDSYGANNTIYVPLDGNVEINISKNPVDANTFNDFHFKPSVGYGYFTVTNPTNGAITNANIDSTSITIHGDNAGSETLGAYYGSGTGNNYGTWRVVVYDPAAPSLTYVAGTQSNPDITLAEGDSSAPIYPTVTATPAEANSVYTQQWCVASWNTMGYYNYTASTTSNDYISVDPTTGVVTAKAGSAGQEHLRAALLMTNAAGQQSILDEYDITVTAAESIPVDSVTLTPTVLNMAAEDTETLTAMVFPSNATDKTVTFTSNATGVAIVNSSTGLVTAVSAGVATITATTANGKTATCTVYVDQNLNITTTALPDTTKGTAYSQTLSATLGSVSTTATWNVSSGALPTGLTLNTATGEISGTTTGSGKSTFTVTAINDVKIASKEFSITVNAAPTITTTSLADGSTVEEYSETLMATGYPAVTWSLDSGSLPTGLTLDSDGSITGTPTAAGTFNFTVKASNGIGADATKTLSITVVAPTVVSAVDVTVTAPVKNVATTNATSSGTGYSVASTSWSPAATTFAASTVYTVSVEVAADSGYALSSATTFKINGETATVSSLTADAAIITYIFPATASNGGSSGGGVTTRTLSFDTNGGSTIAAVSKTSGSVVSLASYTTTRDGYTFDGWYSDAALTNKVTSVTLTANTTVYAKWTAIAVTPDSPFSDVKDSDWFAEDVEFVYEEGLMQGTSTTTFSPYISTTRGMIVTILYRLEGEPTVTGSCPFTDVKSGSYYEKAITWAAANGVVEGYGNGLFGPDANITREQMAAILYRYSVLKGYDVSVGEDTNILSYNDASSISEYAIPAMQWACGEGLIQGDANNLMPAGQATRAQVAAILHRFCENIVK